MRTRAPSSMGFSARRRSASTSFISWRSKKPEPPLVTYGMPCRRSSSSNSRGSMRTECERTAMSRNARPLRCSLRMVSATERASVRESGAMTTVTAAPPHDWGALPRVATRSGSPEKSGSRRMKSVAQSRMPWYERRLWVSGKGRPGNRVLSVQVERSVTEAFGIDAATLQLEQEPEAGSQEVVQVVDRQCAERVGVERCCGAAAQSRHELLLEQALPGLVQDTHLARSTDEVGELVE